MANPLAKTIMNNISKKSLDKDIKQGYCKSSEGKEVCNINKEEEELLKSILNKNNTKINLTSLKNKSSNSLKKTDLSKVNALKENISKKESQKTFIKDLANKKQYKNSESEVKNIESQKSKNPTIKAQSLKSLSNKSLNDISKQIPKENKKKKITSLKDLAK